MIAMKTGHSLTQHRGKDNNIGRKYWTMILGIKTRLRQIYHRLGLEAGFLA